MLQPVDQPRPRAKTIAIVFLLFCTIVAVDQFSAWLRRRLVGDQAFDSAAGTDGAMTASDIEAHRSSAIPQCSGSRFCKRFGRC